ncbi:MAG TPA: cytochrome c3 family protein [Candidatus Polarisedimenticolia bacterium]|nr:cytochrome c3 family protein [Candidatus Polarisedimenticolia bacterium]
MAQIFHRSTNFLSKLSIFGALFFITALGAVVWLLLNSPWMTRATMPIDQPVPFSHEHHVRGLGIDCRYCHTSVETSSFAGIPPIKTCMTCHSQIWKDSPMLEPIREAYKSGVAVRWKRVHDLPEFVFFNHSIHINKGIGCASCHGRVDMMPLTWQVETLHMRWCLRCHQHPERYVRPRGEVFNLAWQPPADQIEQGRALLKTYHINTQRLSDCVMCHR